MNDSEQLRRAMGDHLADVRTEAVDVRLQGRDERYWIVSGTRRDDVAAAD